MSDHSDLRKVALLDQLREAAKANPYSGNCQACDALAAMDEDVAQVVRQMIDGGIVGVEKLSKILTRNGYPTGRRALKRHKDEGHK